MRRLIRDTLAYRELLLNLVLKDLKLKYRGSFLGFLWSLLNPVLTLGVYAVVFSRIARLPVDDYPLFLLSGLLPWTFFSAASLTATGSILYAGGLVRQARFPYQTLPVASVLFCFIQFLLAAVALLPLVVLSTGARPASLAPLALLVLPVHLAFALGVGLALSVMTVVFRDVGHLTEVALFLLLWATPIVYPAELAPAGLRLWFAVSPLAGFATTYQDLIVRGRLPGLGTVGMLAAWTLASLALGMMAFGRYERRLAEWV